MMTKVLDYTNPPRPKRLKNLPPPTFMMGAFAPRRPE